MWCANGGDLHTTKLLLVPSTDLITPSPIFKTSFSLPRRDWLQHLRILFLTHLSLFHRFLSWHLVWRVPEGYTGPWATASPPSPWSQPHLATSRRRNVYFGEEEGYSHWVRANPELLLSAESTECVGMVSDPLISPIVAFPTSCYFTRVVIYWY